MNREIIFRAKQPHNGEWMEGDFSKDYVGVAYITTLDGVSTGVVDESTLGQFTGLTDSKGNKVFEGDIVVDEALNKGVVVWLTDAAQFLCDFGMDYHDIGTWATIIGNQFDNPELI